MDETEIMQQRLSMLEARMTYIESVIDRLSTLMIKAFGQCFYDNPGMVSFDAASEVGNIYYELKQQYSELDDDVGHLFKDTQEWMSEIRDLISFKFIPVKEQGDPECINPPEAGEYVVILSNGKLDMRLWNGSSWDEDDEVKVHGWRLQ